MLVAKINPPAKRIMQPTPFTSTEITGEYMAVKCTELIIGGGGSLSDKVRFSIKFGNLSNLLKPDGSVDRVKLDEILHTSIEFTQQELSDWGTDDLIIYNKIAQKFGFNIVSTEEVDIPFTN